MKHHSNHSGARRVRQPRMMPDLTGETTGIHCTIISVETQAVTIEIGGRNARRITLPRGQVTVTGSGTISMPAWLAQERGLI